MTGREQDSFLIRSDSPAPFAGQDHALRASILDHMSDAIVAEDLGGTIIFWNDAATRLLGHSADEMIGRPMHSLAPQEHWHDEGLVAARVRAGERPAPYGTIRLNAAGEAIPLSITTSPLRDRDQAIAGASHLLRSIVITPPAAAANDRGDIRPAGRSILVVEDEFIIGLSLASTLENAGFEVLGPATSVGEAMELLARNPCALAILDVNLGHDETSEPLARHLKDVGIPFFVTSGYAADQRPSALRGVPSFSKPVGARAILAAVQAVLR